MSESSEQERAVKFLMGWMMEFGSQPVRYETFSNNSWWRRAVKELHEPTYNGDVEGCFDLDKDSGEAWINDRGRKLLEDYYAD